MISPPLYVNFIDRVPPPCLLGATRQFHVPLTYHICWLTLTNVQMSQSSYASIYSWCSLLITRSTWCVVTLQTNAFRRARACRQFTPICLSVTSHACRENTSEKVKRRGTVRSCCARPMHEQNVLISGDAGAQLAGAGIHSAHRRRSQKFPV